MTLDALASNVDIQFPKHRHVARGVERSVLEVRQQSGLITPDAFLRRGYHTSAVTKDHLYIDGGQISFLDHGNFQRRYVDHTLSLDLTQDWTNDTITYNTIIKPAGMPLLRSGTLWYDESKNVLYTGFTGWNTTYCLLNDSKIDVDPSLWSLTLDDQGGGQWGQVIDSETFSGLGILQAILPATASGSKQAWSFGGIGSNQTEGALGGTLQFDMDQQRFSNITYQGMPNALYRGQGHYVSEFGPEGLFFAMGGYLGTSNHMANFSTILVFDPQAEKWYNQTTVGSPPNPRIDFCVAGIASRNSSYEIFVYNGFPDYAGPTALPYDTIKILTIPAFTWVDVPYVPSSSRSSHTCHAVGGSQILVVGGIDQDPPNPILGKQDCTTNDNYRFSTSDPLKQGLGIFDLSTFSWSDHYSAKPQPYVQNDAVSSRYSLQSQKAILSPEIEKLMAVKNFPAASQTTSATPSASADHSHTSSSKSGTIAAAVVVPIVVLLLLAGVVWFIFRRRRRARMQAHGVSPNHEEKPALSAFALQELSTHEQRPSELPNGDMPAELKSGHLVELGPGEPRPSVRTSRSGGKSSSRNSLNQTI